MPKKNKSKLQFNNKSTYKVSKTTIGWLIPKNIAVEYSDTEYLGEYSGSKLYATISEKYSYDTRWSAALSKGMAKSQRSCGVKYLKIGYECKIAKADERLFSNKLYQNESGEYLIYFDRELNHKGIKRAIKATSELSIEECADLVMYDNPLMENDVSDLYMLGNIDEIGY